ncbi:AMP-binding protein [Cellulomonas uda]|uniref:Putative fatty-acid-CoA ligase FadD n=1 Tax=Cellulomonas uda TaxID=1714 RepID=A0A4Y3K9Q1_CELUD|nr:class I adenylate-forming enzyme family protein [Cellulomonas uda]NII66662.1 acyl-coenzyme A synthetase/AMP-(fatty) acid ligase [Cellulomonas uda]GEA79708.1 putative fatty-acid-CoA ligase FadD [Cellulomonas uda]
MIYQRLGNRGIRLGTLFARGHRANPRARVVTDHDLDLAPGRREFSMADLQALVEDFSARLWSAGLRTGDQIVVYKSDNVDVTLLACACARIGVVPVLLSPKLEPATAFALVQRLGRPHLLTDPRKLSTPALADVAGHVATLLTVGAWHEGVDLVALTDRPPVPEVEVSPDAPLFVTHTSGTTGLPKLAVHTRRTMQSRYRPQSLFARLVPRREAVAIHVSFVHSRIFTALPIAVLHGHDVALLREDDPAAAADLLARVRPGLVEAHPNTFTSWEVLADDPDGPLADVRVFSSTFDAAHPRTVEAMLHASRRRRPVYVQMYGQSEVGPIAWKVYDRRRGMPEGRDVGRGFPLSTAIRVVPRDGRRPSREHPGDIEVRSDGRIVTYLAEHERWLAQVHDGWWRMGDVGYKDARGNLHLQDREIDLIDGVPSTLEVEDRLLVRLPEVAEIVVVELSEGPTAVLCTRDGRPLDPTRWSLASQDLPVTRRVQLPREQMPTTSTTKVRRRELVALLEGR